MTERKSESERAELVALADRLQSSYDKRQLPTWGDIGDAASAALRLAAQDQKPMAKIECHNCHNANKYGDYEGPTCDVCLGDGFVSPPPAAGWNDAIEAACKICSAAADETHNMSRMAAAEEIREQIEALRHNAPPDTGAGRSELTIDVSDFSPENICRALAVSESVPVWIRTLASSAKLHDHGGADDGVIEQLVKKLNYWGKPSRRLQNDHVPIKQAMLEAARALSHPPAPVAANSSAEAKNALYWAVGRWNAEVLNRPLQNIHRRSLDDTWRQVMRHFGGDDRELCGPTHDELLDGGAHPHASDCDKQGER